MPQWQRRPVSHYLIRNFSSFAPSCSLAFSQRGLRPRPVQVSLGSSGFKYLAATVRPLPPRPPKTSLSLKPASATIVSIFLRRSLRLRSCAVARAFLTFSSSSCSSRRLSRSSSLDGSLAISTCSPFLPNADTSTWIEFNGKKDIKASTPIFFRVSRYGTVFALGGAHGHSSRPHHMDQHYHLLDERLHRMKFFPPALVALSIGISIR